MTPFDPQKIQTTVGPDEVDTIAAIATAPGAGGIGVVRLSGPLALPLLSGIFRPTSASFTSFAPRMLHYGRVMDAQNREIDAGLAVFFPAPHSFTGEDTAEIQGHGGVAVLNAVLETVLEQGARLKGHVRLAQHGEFTRRAFLNGRIDLSQAEAVAELVAAPSSEGARLASAKLEGLLGRKVSELRGRLEYLRQRVCLAVDFPDEEADCLPPAEFQAVTREVVEGVAELLAAYRRARCWNEGALVVLAGKVNAGKSSLMNALLGRPRAIVTEQPGTTRDYLEEQTSLAGLPVRLVDTAGLRSCGGDLVEREGMRRGRALMDAAQAVLVVLDGTTNAPTASAAGTPSNKFLDFADAELIQQLGPDRCIIVWNKTDLAPCPPNWLAAPQAPCRRVNVSARTGQGLDRLADAVREVCAAQPPQPEEIAPNLRQARALEQALTELKSLDQDIANAVPPDVCGLRLESAAAYLADITGLDTTEETLNAIFADFCIGK